MRPMTTRSTPPVSSRVRPPAGRPPGSAASRGALDEARARLRAAGARVTQARVLVLAILLEAEDALSQLDVQQRVEADAAASEIDRVTLYRVLDWLTDAGLAHRVAGVDRVFRFSVHGAGPHGHFRCTRCARTWCMKEAGGLSRTVRAMVPDGFAPEAVELTVSGVCAHCGGAATGAGAAGR